MSPRENHVDRAKIEVDTVFRGVKYFLCYPRVQSILNSLYWMFIKSLILSTLRLVWKQSRPSECLSLCLVFRKFKRSYDVRQNRLFTWVYNINIIYVCWIFWIYNSSFNICTCSGYQLTHLFEQTYPHCILWLRCTDLQDRNSYFHRTARIL